MTSTCRVAIGVVCLAITGADVGWADSAQLLEEPAAEPVVLSMKSPKHAAVDWLEPYEPHVTRGSTVRLGTAVGFIYGERLDVLALGVTVAAGQRWGRFAIESEFSFLTLQRTGSADGRVGDAQRLAAIARVDVVRLGSRWVGAHSMFALYVEGGAAVAWNHWYDPAATEATSDAMRVVPANTKRVEGQGGFGVELDHRLQQPIRFPKRIGWFLGWRLAFAPHDSEPASLCRGAVCTAMPVEPTKRFVDRSMLFQSSLSATW